MTNRRFVLIALLLVLAVGILYGPTLRHEFLNYDDDVYILNNPGVTGGLTWRGFVWAFGFHAMNWHPLTWLSHMLDCQIFGLFAGGHHLVGAGLHAANAVLLLAVLRAMTGAFWRSAAVAALFALHPLRVESVAWAAERKDVLSSLFWILALGAYLGYVRRPAARRYLAALGLFALGLAAKPMLVTLPFVLLLLDWWPLGRTGPLRPAAGAEPTNAGRRSWRALVLEKTPFLALSLASSLVTWRAQTLNVAPNVTPDLATRLGNAALSYIAYLASFAWPRDLAPLYPYPRNVAWEEAGFAAGALVLLSVVVFSFGRRRPFLLVGWLWYLGTLVPVIGLVQVGAQARSDRYTYLSLIGVALGLVWLVASLRPLRPGTRRAGFAMPAAAVLFAGALAALATSSASYVRVWRNTLSLFEHTARVTRDNYLALNNLAGALNGAGRNDDAIRVLREAARINPEYCESAFNLGNALARERRFQEALAPFHLALQCAEGKKIRPAFFTDIYLNLGTVQLLLGGHADAERHFRALLEIRPDHPQGRSGLIETLVRQGKRPR